MKTSDVLFALAVGVAAAVLRIACAFFPWLNVADVVVFLAAGYWVGRRRANPWWASAALLIVPSIAFMVFGLTSIGLERLREGVGVGHLYGLFLLPLSAGCGTWLGVRRSGDSAAA
jgi:hypothetical protein